MMKRIENADAVRGFSLLGIFMANLLIFQFGLSGKDHMEFYNLNGLNEFVFKTVKVIFEGSFLPIFALLFGFSMDKLFQSMKNKEMKWKRFKLLCRAAGIITLGLLHSYFIWEGDILLAYGIAMIIFIPFIGLPKWFFKIITILLAAGLVGITALSFFIPVEDIESAVSAEAEREYMSTLNEVYSSGSYSEILNARQNLDDPFLNELMTEDNILILLLGIIMPAILYAVGVYLSKSGWFSKDADAFWSSKIFIYLIPVSIILKSSIYWSINEEIAYSLNFMFAFVLSFGLMSLIKYLYNHYENSKVMTGLKSMGKLSLTIYIMQSIIGTTVFYGYGIGMFGTDIFMWSVLIFIVCYVLQMIMAVWYLKHFTYGPLEYILRTVTYMNFRKKKWSRDMKDLKGYSNL
ncbi:hypothetical protein GCM10007275_21110 [Jeotgalicoccus coquinae]|uniref:DUF418 domain-containing protein n=1 Tax=Jeotgalicoccus coquinae TaxID=709509 RepID=A0A6V7RR30_9STAP|nr:DUF418 domain-containing protein [Jeotgalicoccus coquinae]MBB6424185.1 uncharacterized protein [Jeotgalicoccus coquinae]GGE25841.1 hypothetical protein GCM10007275_21110 [Jeotgalicoccus coquinae]CAD2081486.1 hypothetical protein JEOCOQ751_01976 [Jeotgalicoccus coquinae]